MVQSTSTLVSQASFLLHAETDKCLGEMECTAQVNLHTLVSFHAVVRNVFPDPTAL